MYDEYSLGRENTDGVYGETEEQIQRHRGDVAHEDGGWDWVLCSGSSVWAA